MCIYISKRNIIKSIRIRIKISLDCSTQAIILLSDLWHSLTHDTSFSWLLPICLYNSIFSIVWCLLSVFCFFVCFFRFPYVSSLLLYIRVPTQSWRIPAQGHATVEPHVWLLKHLEFVPMASWNLPFQNSYPNPSLTYSLRLTYYNSTKINVL